ncbi:DUF6278 family protein, partial [Jatrophihabitans lederbergiae]|uniref:DUF6278 family protein n=1 Tax=Jatrophihabitans lederbergiae TaxID=3075547 RepID=UPI0037BFC3EA
MNRHWPAAGQRGWLYLGTVIVKCVPGAAWHVWPNCHPVVRLPSANDLDLTDQVHRRLTSHEGSLMSIYAAAPVSDRDAGFWFFRDCPESGVSGLTRRAGARREGLASDDGDTGWRGEEEGLGAVG